MLETAIIEDKVCKCENIEEFKKDILPVIKTQKDLWKEKINSIIENNKYTKSRFAELCGVSRVAVDKWCKGNIPKNRETFIRIGFVANYNLDEIDELLSRYGKYPKLYPKTLEDCVCIYALNNGKGMDAYMLYTCSLDKIIESISGLDRQADIEYNTDELLDSIKGIKSEEEFNAFVKENVSVFGKSYKKLYAYVDSFIKLNNTNPVDGSQFSVSELADMQKWSSSLRHCVSEINQKKWYPTRNKIISLGLHLNMTHSQVNKMLSLAKMEPLCAKNIFEDAIIFILENSELNDWIFTDGDDSLCIYAREILLQLKNQKIDGSDNSADFEMFEDFINELPDGEV